MDRFIGKVLDNRYEILEVIGAGGMAVVYKAKCHRLNRHVALKVLRDEYAVDDDFRRRFYDESQAVAMLSHPNIVAVYDVSRTEGIEYIVMELIDGITLKEYMSRRGVLSWNEVTFFSIQIAKALEHAHSRGIVHRDIKPQNIMLLRDGTVKVADFGIARHVSKQETYNMGEAIGSVHYVSPEQAKGSYIDNRADLYSFGVVMYEMLTGRLPFEGDTPISIALQHINSIALPPSDHVPTIPAALEAITMKAMNPSLSRRYASATQMLYDLEGFKSDPEFRVIIPKADVPVLDTEAPGHTRRLNNTGEVDVPRFPQRRGEGGASPTKVMQRTITAEPEEEEEPVKVRKTTKRERREREHSGFPASLIFSIFAIGCFFVGAVWFMMKIVNPFGDPDIVKLDIPELAGIPYEALMNDAKYADLRENFKFQEGSRQFNSEFDAGVIYDQYPRAGSRQVNPGTLIRVDISSGISTEKMENWVGQEYTQVYNRLVASGFIGELIIVVQVNHDTVPAGMIISQVPAPGDTMKPGEGIHFNVSLGKEGSMVKMPKLEGMTLAEAIAALKEVGLKIGEVDPDFTTDAERWGKVTWQMVLPDTEVQEGTLINVKVAEEDKEATEPDDTTEPPPTTTLPPTTTAPAGTVVGLSYDPYATNSNRVTLYRTFSLIASDGVVMLEVYVNGNLEYSGTHNSSEQWVGMTLTGLGSEETGYDNIVKVMQNGSKTTEQTYTFVKPQ